MDPANRKWVSEHLRVPEREVEAMASRLSASDRSLNAPLNIDGEGEWQDFLVDETALPETQAIENNDRKRYQAWIEHALQSLSPRENFIIQKRRMSDDSVTLAEIGAELGISKERVRQIEVQALLKLKTALEKIAGDFDRLELLAG